MSAVRDAALIAVDTFGYTPSELGFLFGSMAIVDLLAVPLSAHRADAVHDKRRLIVPGIIGASASCAWVGTVAALAQGAIESVLMPHWRSYPLFSQPPLTSQLSPDALSFPWAYVVSLDHVTDVSCRFL